MDTSKTQPFLRHAIVYGLGSTLLQAAGVLLLPLYTRYLSPAEYGTLEVFIRIGEVIAICLLFNGIRQAVLVLHGQSATDEERQRVAPTAVAVVATGAALGGLVVLVVPGALAELLDFDDAGLLQLAVLAAVLDGACFVLLALSQARTQSMFFVTVTFAQFLGRVGLCLVLVAGLGWGIRGVLVASVAMSGACATTLAVRELLSRPIRVDCAQARAMLCFALPFLLCGLGFFLIHNGDRFFLLHWAGPGEVGIYSFGYKLALAVPMFTRTPLIMTWGPRIYELAQDPDAPELFGRAFTRMLAVYVFVGLSLCLMLNEVIASVGGAAYAAAVAVVPPLVLAYYFLAAADLMDGAFYVRRRSDLKTWVALFSTTMMMALYVLLIPRFGAAGAAWATLAGLASHAALTWIVARRIFTIRYEFGRQAAMLALASVLWLMSRWLPAALWTLPVKAALFLLWPLLLWKMGVIRPDEKAWLLARLRRRSGGKPEAIPSVDGDPSAANLTRFALR